MGNPRILKVDGTDQPLEIAALDFDIAIHNAVITVEHDGDHRTFMIRTVQDGERFGNAGDRLVSLLIGPDRSDSRNWDNFGFVASGGVINVFHKKRGEIVEDKYKKSPYEYYALMLMNPVCWEAKGYVYLLMTFCRRCNKPLTVPESITSGMGAVCRGLER